MTNCNNNNFLIWLYLLLLGAVVYHVWSANNARNLSESVRSRPVSSVVSMRSVRPVESAPIQPVESIQPAQLIQPLLPINVPTRGYYGDFGLVGYLQQIGQNFRNSDRSPNEMERSLDKLHKPGCRNTVKLDHPFGLRKANSVAVDQDLSNTDRDQDRNDRNPEYMLRLYGRQIDSNRYEYYTTNHWDPQIKISLHVPRDDQLTDGDLVRVPGYGQYRVVTYQPAYPGYI